jgi:hypothetical protein
VPVSSATVHRKEEPGITEVRRMNAIAGGDQNREITGRQAGVKLEVETGRDLSPLIRVIRPIRGSLFARNGGIPNGVCRITVPFCHIVLALT